MPNEAVLRGGVIIGPDDLARGEYEGLGGQGTGGTGGAGVWRAICLSW